MQYRDLVAIALLLFFLNGCSGDMPAQFGMMFEIKRDIIKEYNHENVSIHISNDKLLTVNFVNSRFNDITPKEKEAKAREIALSTVLSMKRDQIDKIAVAFTLYEKKYFIIDYTSSQGVFFFDVSELLADVNERQLEAE